MRELLKGLVMDNRKVAMSLVRIAKELTSPRVAYGDKVLFNKLMEEPWFVTLETLSLVMDDFAKNNTTSDKKDIERLSKLMKEIAKKTKTIEQSLESLM
jgi:hypothetical protein